MVPPGRSRPSASAASIIFTAIRSFTEPPGLRYSTLASTVAAMPSVTRFNRTNGVSPIRSTTESANFISLGMAHILTEQVSLASRVAGTNGRHEDVTVRDRQDHTLEERVR